MTGSSNPAAVVAVASTTNDTVALHESAPIMFVPTLNVTDADGDDEVSTTNDGDALTVNIQDSGSDTTTATATCASWGTRLVAKTVTELENPSAMLIVLPVPGLTDTLWSRAQPSADEGTA
jgi:hypothetical protein